jgi:hypothetical protein
MMLFGAAQRRKREADDAVGATAADGHQPAASP